MTDTNVLPLSQPGTFSDPLTEVLRNGARACFRKQLVEVTALLNSHADKLTDDGHRRRAICATDICLSARSRLASVRLQCAARVCDEIGEGCDHVRFRRRSCLPRAIEEPRGQRSRCSISRASLPATSSAPGVAGQGQRRALGLDHRPAQGRGLVGRAPAGGRRDLSAKRYVAWADGIHVQARLEDDSQCLLVIIGATPEGKELVGLIDGCAERPIWRELLLDLKRRGPDGAQLAVADGALGFWQAIEEVWPKTRGQRCWVHKTANVLNKLPKSQHSKAKRALQGTGWLRPRRMHSAFDAFVETWGVKYDKAVECLIKVATRYWPSTTSRPSTGSTCATNVIESSFATIRHRTVRSRDVFRTRPRSP